MLGSRKVGLSKIARGRARAAPSETWLGFSEPTSGDLDFGDLPVIQR
jgi:hypothetical protein